MSGLPIPAFSAYGIELEYMIVDRDTLAVQPLADHILRDDAGNICSDIDRGDTGWSNEVVLHLIELKNPRPTPDLHALHGRFQHDIAELNARLEPHNACLMPTGMHPWMDPATETRLWPHQHAEIYQAYDRIFDCRQHGWANLQSMHLNLPFRDDEEFARLHAAARLVLPLLPALAASSPVIEGKLRGWMDTRMEMYRHHEMRIPSLLGEVIPDSFISRNDYEHRQLAPMYRDLAMHDPAGVLRHEWVNAHGLIARFDRSALEIRVIDMQECPAADLAIAAATVALVRHLYEHTDTLAQQQAFPTRRLVRLLQATTLHGEQAWIDDTDYLETLGLPRQPQALWAVWRRLLEDVAAHDSQLASWMPTLEIILREGPLARRILRALAPSSPRTQLESLYRRLCACLANGTLFHA